MQGDDGQVWVPLVHETLYPVIFDPLLAGVDQLTLALLFARATVMLVGASGTLAGTTLSD